MIKKHFNKELVMSKKENEVFKNSTKCLICDKDYVHNGVKVKDQCHITGKYTGGSEDRNSIINL